MDRTLAALPDELKRALMLREFDGLAYEDIARVMDYPDGTVHLPDFQEAQEAIDVAIRPLLET